MPTKSDAPTERRHSVARNPKATPDFPILETWEAGLVLTGTEVKSLRSGKASIKVASALQAALFSSLLWELAKHLFAWYVVHLARYSVFYGSLSTLVIFDAWVYYSSTILVVGGEFAYFLEEDRQRSMPRSAV